MNGLRIAACAFLAALAAAALAQEDGDAAAPAQAPAPVIKIPLFAPSSARTARPMSLQQREDWQFLKVAAASSRFERDAARLALAKSDNPRLRSVALDLIERHSTTGNELQHMLQQRGMAAPMLPNLLNRLSRLQGVKFEREFMAQVALKHQREERAAFERAGAAPHDPQVKAWIERTLLRMRDPLVVEQRVQPQRPGLPQPVALKVSASGNR